MNQQPSGFVFGSRMVNVADASAARTNMTYDKKPGGNALAPEEIDPAPDEPTIFERDTPKE